MSPRIETARLVLRPVVASDAAEFQRLANHPLIGATTRIPYPMPEGFAEEYVVRVNVGHRWVLEKKDGAFTGMFYLFNEPGGPSHRAELGYWIAVDEWGNGYAKEAARAVCAFAFRELGLHRIVAHIQSENTASIRVVEALGFKYEGALRDEVHRDGRYTDLCLYGLLEGELNE